MIYDLPSSHRSWKGRYFFVSGFNWEYNPSDRDDTLGVPTVWRLQTWYSSEKMRMMGGRRGLRPWPLRCLSQILPERKDGLL